MCCTSILWLNDSLTSETPPATKNYITIDTETGAIRWTKASESTGEPQRQETQTVDMKILSSSQREMTQHQTMIAEMSVNGPPTQR